jgi:hypothetical protein
MLYVANTTSAASAVSTPCPLEVERLLLVTIKGMAGLLGVTVCSWMLCICGLLGSTWTYPSLYGPECTGDKLVQLHPLPAGYLRQLLLFATDMNNSASEIYRCTISVNSGR